MIPFPADEGLSWLHRNKANSLAIEPQHLTMLFGETRNEEIMGDAIEAVLGALRVASGYSSCMVVTEHLDWGDVGAILHGLEHSLLFTVRITGTACRLAIGRTPSQALFVQGSRCWGDGMVCSCRNPYTNVLLKTTKGEYIAARSAENTSRMMRSTCSSMRSWSPELGRTEEDENVVMVDAEDGQEGTDSLSPDPDYGTSPEPQEGDR